MEITNQLIDRTLESCQNHMKTRGLSSKTRKSYASSIRRFLYWQKSNWGKVEPLPHQKRMEAFISSLANDKTRPIAFSTQNAYFNAVLYFYREFQGKEIGKIRPAKAPRSQRIFTLLSLRQLADFFKALPTTPINFRLIARLMYGTGARLDECLSLRVKDLLFDETLIAIQEGKGDKSRFVDMPKVVIDDLKNQLVYTRSQFDTDRALNKNGVHLPGGLERKYPAWAVSWEWYWVFPHFQEGYDPDSGKKRRFHVYDFDVQRAFRETRRRIKLPEHTTAHTLRHCYATHYLRELMKQTEGLEMDTFEFCYNALRKKLGHVSPQTTKTYIHLATKKKYLDLSPLDVMEKK